MAPSRSSFSVPESIVARLIGRLTAAPAIHVVLALVPIGFLLLEAWRSYPFVDDAPPDLHKDDWHAYRAYAESVLRDGWTMPVVAKDYSVPGGFLYVYFVAATMGVLGENATAVYLVQSALLGLAAVVAYVGLARGIGAGVRLAYLGLSIAFLYLDVFRHYTNRLLSENLVVILLPVSLALLLRARESPARGAAAGVALGATILTRPNLLPLAPAAAALLVGSRRPTRRALGSAAALLAGAVAVLGVMVFRNYVVTGAPSAGVFTERWHWMRPSASPDASRWGWAWSAIDFYGRRVLFMLGWLPALDPAYRIRPHWLLMWAGVAVFVATLRRRHVAFWEAALLVALLAYVTPLLAVAHVANYGFRMFVPIVPVALLLAIDGVTRWWAAEPPPPSSDRARA